MKKVASYREELRHIEEWESYLLRESRLPGPRANLELAQAVAEEGNDELFRRWITFDPERAPANSPCEFLALCGVLGLGRLLSEGRREFLETLRAHASDPRWRIREGVAMALQLLGQKNMDFLILEMEKWGKGNPLEKRAAAAALCEPRLLSREDQIERVLQILDDITASIQEMTERKSEEFNALKKGLGYCWSVAAIASPEKGKELMGKWISSEDKDVLWIMKENLKKNRLSKMDREWVEQMKSQVNGARGVK